MDHESVEQYQYRVRYDDGLEWQVVGVGWSRGANDKKLTLHKGSGFKVIKERRPVGEWKQYE